MLFPGDSINGIAPKVCRDHRQHKIADMRFGDSNSQFSKNEPDDKTEKVMVGIDLYRFKCCNPGCDEIITLTIDTVTDSVNRNPCPNCLSVHEITIKTYFNSPPFVSKPKIIHEPNIPAIGLKETALKFMENYNNKGETTMETKTSKFLPLVKDHQEECIKALLYDTNDDIYDILNTDPVLAVIIKCNSDVTNTIDKLEEKGVKLTNEARQYRVEAYKSIAYLIDCKEFIDPNTNKLNHNIAGTQETNDKIEECLKEFRVDRADIDATVDRVAKLLNAVAGNVEMERTILIKNGICTEDEI
jgi:uncharacterized protein YaaR (DUF327 family)